MRTVKIEGFEYTLPEDPETKLNGYTHVRDLSKDLKKVTDIIGEHGGQVNAVAFCRITGLINLMADEIERLRAKEALWLEPTQAMIDAGIKELESIAFPLSEMMPDELSNVVVFTLQAIASKRNEKAKP